MNTQSNSLLFETGTEELPVGYFIQAKSQLETTAKTAFEKARLTFQEIKVTGTPRRLTLIVTELSAHQTPETREVRGPAIQVSYDKDGNPSKALIGFTKSQGIDLKEVITKEEGNREYIYAVIKDEGKPTTQILQEILPKLILSLSFPKVMRWEGEAQDDTTAVLFARPIRWLLCLYGNEVIPIRIGCLKGDNKSYGHRFLSSKPVTVSSVEEYIPALKKEFVLVDVEERQGEIKKTLENSAEKINGKLHKSVEYLLTELTHLVEYPCVFTGKFEERFLELPQEVLTTVMIHHQRYVPLEKPQSTQEELLPLFLGVRNGNDYKIENVIAGNERVLKARLADAVYFFKKDQEFPLRDRVNKLDSLVFQKNLGSYGAKTNRIKSLCKWLVSNAKILCDSTVKSIQQASQNKNIEELINQTATLCKTDLLTQMVFELPELQGVMGRIYALKSGEEKDVALGIEEHYCPSGASGKLPSTLIGAIVGIADRADTLAGCFGLGLIPSGSRDPYGLRRAALGIINVTLHHKLLFPMSLLFKEALNFYIESGILKPAGVASSSGSASGQKVASSSGSLKEFITGRIEGEISEQFQEYAKQNDLAGFMLELSYEENLLDVFGKIKVIGEARQEKPEEFTAQVMAAVRIVNILKKSDSAHTQEYKINQALFQDKEESQLWGIIEKVHPIFEKYIAEKKYAKGWEILHQLVLPINNFFDKVLVNAPDENIRKNRFALLGELLSIFNHFGNLSKLILE